MLAKADVIKFYETVLVFPGMNENLRISFSIPRRNVLFLSKIIERVLSDKEGDGKLEGIVDVVSKENLQELQSLPLDLLEKAGLSEMNEKLKSV